MTNAAADRQPLGTRAGSFLVATVGCAVACLIAMAITTAVQVFWNGEHQPNHSPWTQFRVDCFTSAVYGGAQMTVVIAVAAGGFLRRSNHVPRRSLSLLAGAICGVSLGATVLGFVQLLLIPFCCAVIVVVLALRVPQAR